MHFFGVFAINIGIGGNAITNTLNGLVRVVTGLPRKIPYSLLTTPTGRGTDGLAWHLYLLIHP